jgi:hypothetical protein
MNSHWLLLAEIYAISEALSFSFMTVIIYQISLSAGLT